MVLLLYAIDQHLYKVQVLPDLFPKAAIFIIIFFILSFIFAVQQPRWQCRTHI